MTDNEPVITINDLPIRFAAKYLGSEPARGLWGMKHTRKPVDSLVGKAKDLPPNTILPMVQIEVSKDGLSFKSMMSKGKNAHETMFKVDCISYGVQDLIYTRVFSMIIVTDKSMEEGLTFICHSFVCESRHHARQITYALAATFQEYGAQLKQDNQLGKSRKRFAIDLRTPEQQAANIIDETEA